MKNAFAKFRINAEYEKVMLFQEGLAHEVPLKEQTELCLHTEVENIDQDRLKQAVNTMITHSNKTLYSYFNHWRNVNESKKIC